MLWLDHGRKNARNLHAFVWNVTDWGEEEVSYCAYRCCDGSPASIFVLLRLGVLRAALLCAGEFRSAASGLTTSAEILSPTAAPVNGEFRWRIRARPTVRRESDPSFPGQLLSANIPR